MSNLGAYQEVTIAAGVGLGVAGTWAAVKFRDHRAAVRRRADAAREALRP